MIEPFVSIRWLKAHRLFGDQHTIIQFHTAGDSVHVAGPSETTDAKGSPSSEILCHSWNRGAKKVKIPKFVKPKILVQLNYSLIYPYRTYSLILWGNTYVTNLNTLVSLHKLIVRIITFAQYDSHTILYSLP